MRVSAEEEFEQCARETRIIEDAYLVGVVLPHKLLELFLEPGASNLLRPLLEVDRELEYLCVVPFRRPPVGVARVLVEPVVLLAAVPHLLAVHRLLQLVVQLLLLLPVLALRVVLPVGDEVERRAKVVDGVVVVCMWRLRALLVGAAKSLTDGKIQRLTHVKKERLGPDQVGFLNGVGADDVAVREPELDRRVAVAQRHLVLAHGALAVFRFMRDVHEIGKKGSES